MTDGGVPFTMPVEPAGTANNSGGFGWGGDGAWWIIILFLFVFCGWGNGFGGFGGGGANSPGFQGYATRADINEGFAMNNLQSGINAIQQGICDASYALNNAIQSGFNTTQMGMMQGFNGVQSQICNLGAQLAQCCCDTRAAIQEVNYNMATNTCNLQNTMNNNTRDLLDNQNSNTRAIFDFLVQSKLDEKDAQIAELQRAASQDRQSALLTTAMANQTAQVQAMFNAQFPQPRPAYVVPNPNCCYGNPVFTNGNGCNAFGGCNCGGCNC